MKSTMQKRGGLVLMLAACAGLGACASQPQTMYQWEGYQPHVYSYLRGDQKSGPDKQIAEMEEDLQKIRAKGNTPPPGYYAHLGMLYASIGNNSMMLQNFQAEQKLFPESAPYMNYLLSNLKK
ncbi:DUF4810 domain-containing protein [Paludibacterium purpuratum]|uniref:DUF4810 domain-containing protein n=1 Tax=Paludibacterium purpuratum TaxID=1144873 RepID=A0A4V3DV07_9NEIS|nr:DUF4810 domain-containing protein [Paludibacterium purpuratum]TDR78397.1 hypothetical protein DFP86_108115 [Paludibacterium purpuratum]